MEPGGFEPAAQTCAVYVKRQIRTSNREVEVEELHGWNLFGFTECSMQDMTPNPPNQCGDVIDASFDIIFGPDLWVKVTGRSN